MTYRKTLVIALLFLTATGIAGISLCQEKLFLSAQGDVAAYGADNWSYQDPPDVVIEAGDTVPVIDCVSDKSDVHVVVEVSGRRYFVGPGEYELLRSRASIADAWTDPDAIFGCVGFLPGISQQAPN